MSEIEPTPSISVAEVARHIEAGDAFILDVRKSKGGSQIYGAINYDPKKLDEAGKLILPLPKSEGLIVLYDEAEKADHVDELAAKLRDQGYATIRVLEGGFKAWKAADGKLEDRTMEQPVPLVSEHQVER